MFNKESKQIDRRDFFRIVGGGALAASAALVGCKPSTKEQRGGSVSQEVPTDKMVYRTAPSSGDKVSLLGYGCMRWPLLKDAPKGTNVIDQTAVNELVDYAIAHGVNYFDVAPVYTQGWAEQATGEALSRHPRSSYFVASKLSNFAKTVREREESIRMYEASFKNLRTDYIDYMLLHAIGGSGMAEFNERYIDNGMLEFLVAERKAGRIRNLGFSYHGAIEVFDHLLSLHDTIQWDFVQIQLNYIDWDYAKSMNPRNTEARYLYGELEKRGIPAIIMEPLLGGRLASLPDHLAKELQASQPNRSIASWAFRYAGSFPGVLTVLSGMTYMEHLQDNIRTFSPLESISDSERDLLASVAQRFVEEPLISCTACQYCMPCPYGLDIPALFHHYNTCVVEDNYPTSQQDKNYREARRAFLVGYDRSVPKLRQASHCIGCGQCISHCPQSIDIPTQLRAIDSYVEKLKQNTL